MTAPFEVRLRYAAAASPRHTAPVRYQFVDCRWELGNPGRGRELYLEGHIPGASFLDVDEDLVGAAGEARDATRFPSLEHSPQAADARGDRRRACS